MVSVGIVSVSVGVVSVSVGVVSVSVGVVSVSVWSRSLHSLPDQIEEPVEAPAQRVAHLRVHVLGHAVHDPLDLQVDVQRLLTGLEASLRDRLLDAVQPVLERDGEARRDRLALVVGAASRGERHEREAQRRLWRAPSLARVEAVGQHDRQPGGLDRLGGLVDRILHPAPARPSRCSVSTTSQAARRSPSRGWPTPPGLSSHLPSEMSRSVPSGAGAPFTGRSSRRKK